MTTCKRVVQTVVTQRVLRWWDYPLFALLTALNLCALVYFAVHWVWLRSWEADPIKFAFLASVLGVLLLNVEGRWFLLLFMRRPRPIPASPGLRVAVATTVVPRAESLEMLEVTLRALVALDYPHDTWLLDEGDDERVRRLCQRVGVRHFSRKNRPEYQKNLGQFQRHSKHGNYNAWLDHVGFGRYDILTIFDPDHIPDPAFLSRALGYFQDPNVGYVQLPQAYYNQKASFIARGAAEETYAFYSSIQMAGYGLGYPVLIGCHNTHRLSALRDIGGFSCHDAEDLLTTLRYRSRGWHGVYVPEILARGLAPVDWQTYLTQQRRWARSVLDIKLRIFVHMSGTLPLKTRLASFLHGFNYLYKSFIMFGFTAYLVYTVGSGTLPRLVSAAMVTQIVALAIALQLCELYRQRFYLDRRREMGISWRAGILQYAKWPYFVIAFWDVVMHRRIPFVLTRKVRVQRRRNFLWPHAISLGVMISAWLYGTLSGRLTNIYLHWLAAVIVVSGIAFLLTGLLDFPDPFDKKLAEEMLRQRQARRGAPAGQVTD
jgi:cellulose synthase (UDP-forming)